MCVDTLSGLTLTEPTRLRNVGLNQRADGEEEDDVKRRLPLFLLISSKVRELYFCR